MAGAGTPTLGVRRNPIAATVAATRPGSTRYGKHEKDQRGVEHGRGDKDTRIEHGVSCHSAHSDGLCVHGVRAARSGEGERHVRRGHEAAKQAGHEISAARADDSSCDIRHKAQAREQQHQSPQFPRSHASKRSEWPSGKERQHDQSHDGKAHAGAEPHVVDPRGERVEPRFFNQQQAGDRDDAAGQTVGADAGGDPGGHDNEGRDLGRAVDVAAAAGDICSNRDRRRRAEQHDRRRRQPAGPQPSTQPCEPAEQGECPDPGKASVRAVGVSRPLPFEADGSAAERRDQHPEEINVRHSWHDGIEKARRVPRSSR